MAFGLDAGAKCFVWVGVWIVFGVVSHCSLCHHKVLGYQLEVLMPVLMPLEHSHLLVHVLRSG